MCAFHCHIYPQRGMMCFENKWSVKKNSDIKKCRDDSTVIYFREQTENVEMDGKIWYFRKFCIYFSHKKTQEALIIKIAHKIVNNKMLILLLLVVNSNCYCGHLNRERDVG